MLPIYNGIPFSSLKYDMDYFELTWRAILAILLSEKHHVAKWHTHYETVYETKETSR